MTKKINMQNLVEYLICMLDEQEKKYVESGSISNLYFG